MGANRSGNPVSRRGRPKEGTAGGRKEVVGEEGFEPPTNCV